MTFNSLPMQPPVPPMLARLVRDIPVGDYLYEPKWDGFRALVFVDGNAVEIQSRHGRPFARYFPDVTNAVRTLGVGNAILDGEIVVIRDGRFDFESLMLRLHPAATRVDALSASTPATFIAFDLLAAGDGTNLLDEPFVERRRQLESLIDPSSTGVRLTPTTDDPHTADAWLHRSVGGGVDGVVAKLRSGVYTPGKRSMLKAKRERTADCVVAGFRATDDGLVASMLLGLYGEDGVLRHVGVCAGFSASRRAELFALLAPRTTSLVGHPWRAGFGLERSPVGRLKGSAGRWSPAMTMDWTPVQPLVVEITYDTVDFGRFRHPAHFRRWRPDRAPESCTFDQLEQTDGSVVDALPLEDRPES